MQKYIGLAVALFIAVLGSYPASAQISKKDYPTQPDLTPKSVDDAVPATFRGQITYRGFYRGKLFVPGPPMRALSLGAMLRSAAEARTLPMGGDFVLIMEFNGSSVSGRTEITNGISGDHGGLDPGHFMGTRQGTTCHLQWNDGTETVAYCGRTEFRAAGNGAQDNGMKFGYIATVPAAETVDFVERDRANAVAAEKERADAAARHAAIVAARARMRAALPPGASSRYTPLLDNAVEEDSMHWMLHRYNSGSIDLVAARFDKQYNATYLKAFFRYADGSEGWVGAIVQGKEVVCLQFWDDPQGCRAIGQGIGSRVASSLVTGMMSGNSRGRGSSESPADEMIERNAACQGEYSGC